MCEVFNLPLSADNDPGDYGSEFNFALNPRSLFGFLPSYYNYKMDTNCISGDFNVRSLSAGLDAWHLFRRYTDEQDGALFAQSDIMRKMNPSDFTKIFNVSDDSVDCFYEFFDFNITQIDESIPLGLEWSELAGNSGSEVDVTPGGNVSH